MASEKQEYVLMFAPGLTDVEPVNSLSLHEGSYNFYPDDEGYLVNYPGKSDIFRRAPDLPQYVSTPPALGVPITRIVGFRDVYGRENIVFVRGAELRVKDGNGSKLLYTFSGIDYDGEYYPSLFVHESKLIICNLGDPPLVWDGTILPHPLGVREVPQPPVAWSQHAPGSDHSVPGGVWKWTNYWWPQDDPGSGPAENEAPSLDDPDATVFVVGIYKFVAQFKDMYGNKGKASAPSNIVYVEPKDHIVQTDSDQFEFLLAEWTPPMVDSHVYGCILGRTFNMNNRDIEGGWLAYDRYYIDYEFNNTTIHRHVSQLSDAAIADNGEIDLDVGPPPHAGGGVSWSNRIFLYILSDPYLVAWSDKGLFGQFRTSNQYRAKDHVVAVVPVSDRIAIITRSSIEILYDAGEYIASLEQTSAHGAYNGRSFVDIGAGIFGLFSSGFGVYDGENVTKVPTPYFIKGVYTDENHFVNSAVRWGDFYVVSVRKDSSSAGNNYLIMYHLIRRQWYLIKDRIIDMTVFRDQLIGSDESIFEVFVGQYDDDSVINVEGFVPRETFVHMSRVLSGIRILMEPSSNLVASIELSARVGREKSESRKATLLPSAQGFGRSDYPVVYWNKPGAKYSDSPQWSAPGDFWFQPSMSIPVEGVDHKMTISFPAGHRVRVKALAMSLSEERRGQ